MGSSKTGRIITSAALIIVVVAVSFTFTSDRRHQGAGLGMAVAVALDATVIRILMVPAADALARALELVAAGWLERLLPHVD